MIRADEHGLVVRNLLLTRRLRWDEVRGFRADGSLVVALAHGPDLRCWAVQSANIAWLLDRRSSPGSDSDPTARSAICPARSTRPSTASRSSPDRAAAATMPPCLDSGRESRGTLSAEWIEQLCGAGDWDARPDAPRASPRRCGSQLGVVRAARGTPAGVAREAVPESCGRGCLWR